VKQAHSLNIRPIKFANSERPTIAAGASFRKLPVTLKRPHLNRSASTVVDLLQIKEKTKQWAEHELCLKRKREDPYDQRDD